MSKTCTACSAQFEITEKDLAFYEKVDVPPPTFCPACRFQRRCSFMNYKNFFLRTVDGAEGLQISMYPQESELNIVEDKLWWSDKYDEMSYGKDYDFEKSFFEQFHSLMKVVPLPHLQRAYSTFENSDYCNAAANLKNCYLVACADFDEDCMYGTSVEECKDSLDMMFTNKSELCYETVNVKSCYDCKFCDDCENSQHLLFCRDCIGCTHCIGCIGLRQKSFCIFNEQYSEEEYMQKLSELDTGSWKTCEEMKNTATDFFRSKPQQFMHGRNNESVSGDYVYQSKDVSESFVVEKSENCKFAHFIRYVDTGTRDAYDYTMFGVGADLVYDSAWCGLGINNVKFSFWNYGSSDIEYCFGCHSSSNLFGCIGLRHKEYCILNKQYSKEEYKELVPKIKEQMMNVPFRDSQGIEYRYGEFFPIELSPFSYNSTIALDFCPITPEECTAKSYGWYEKESKTSDARSWKNLPENIRDTDDSILSEQILCRAHEEDPEAAKNHNCSQHFRITSQELDFYRRQKLPLPRYCYNSRHFHRLEILNPFKTWTRTCAKCSTEIQTTFAPERPEIVYCEECYLKEVY